MFAGLDNITGGSFLDAVNVGGDVLQGVNKSIDDLLSGKPGPALVDFFKESGKGVLAIPDDVITLMKDYTDQGRKLADLAIDSIIPNGPANEAIKSVVHVPAAIGNRALQTGANALNTAADIFTNPEALPRDALNTVKDAGVAVVDTFEDIGNTLGDVLFSGW